MRVIVTGAQGQLGHDVVEALRERHETIGLGRKEMDLTRPDAIPDILRNIAPDCIVHCGAYTKVDKAELEPDLCRLVNGTATGVLAKTAEELSSHLIYISTDYVFDGRKGAPYETDDRPAPLNVYGNSKLEGEIAVRSLLREHHIVRTSWVFGNHGHNFVETMLKLGWAGKELRVISDQIGSPTYTRDLAALLAKMVEDRRYGTYHATNEGECSWYDFAQEIFRLAGIDATMRPVRTEEYATKAIRPRDSRLSKASLDHSMFSRLPHWRDGLERYMIERRGSTA